MTIGGSSSASHWASKALGATNYFRRILSRPTGASFVAPKIYKPRISPLVAILLTGKFEAPQMGPYLAEIKIDHFYKPHRERLQQN